MVSVEPHILQQQLELSHLMNMGKNIWLQSHNQLLRFFFFFLIAVVLWRGVLTRLWLQIDFSCESLIKFGCNRAAVCCMKRAGLSVTRHYREVVGSYDMESSYVGG